MMAEDSDARRRRLRAHRRRQDRRARGLRGVRRLPRHARSTSAATWASAPPTSTTSRSASSPHLAGRAGPGRSRLRPPVRARRPRPRAGRHGTARPRPRCSASSPREGGPTSHTAILAREKSIVAIVGVAGRGRAGRRRRGHRRRGAPARSPSPRPTPQRADAQRRIDERARRSRRRRGARRPRRRHARSRCSPTSARPTARRRPLDAGRRGRRAVPHRVPLPRLSAWRRRCEQQREQYTKLLERLPRQEGRRARARRRRRQAARVPERRPRGEPGARPARPARAARQRGHPARAAHGARRGRRRDRRRPLGHGADGRDRRGDPVLHRPRPPNTASRRPASWSRSPRPRCSPTASCARPTSPRIGTNDLTQYTLAADRLLGSVAGFQDPWHPAVLRLIGEVGAAGAAAGKPVGICGEAAADPLLAVVLVGPRRDHPLDVAGGARRRARCPSSATPSTRHARWPRPPWPPTARPKPGRRSARPPNGSPPTHTRTETRHHNDIGVQTSTTHAKKPGGARVHVQRFGTFLSNMVMPNIAAFIAWGIITALFIAAGPAPEQGHRRASSAR